MPIKYIMEHGFTETQAKQINERFYKPSDIIRLCSLGPINFDFVMGTTDDIAYKILRADRWLFDDDGYLIDWGNHADYDCFALEVMNGDGYYDEEGHYHSYRNAWE